MKIYLIHCIMGCYEDTEDNVIYAFLDEEKAEDKLKELNTEFSDVLKQHDKCLGCIYHEVDTTPDETELKQYCKFGDFQQFSIGHFICKNYMDTQEDVPHYYIQTIEISE